MLIIVMMRKGVGAIYKQLAKAIHPDLEQDLALKIEKEELMKKLTTAHEQNDLHTLLSLELEWMNRSENAYDRVKLQTEDQLKIYNSILKKQIEDLEERIEDVFVHPKYISIFSFFREGIQEGNYHPQMMQKVFIEGARHFETVIKDLQSPDATHHIRELIVFKHTVG